MRRTPVRTLWLALGVLLAAGPAAASPSFDLVIGSGAVSRLAVGETLHLVAYLPGVYRGANPLVPVPLAWTVEPEGYAVVTDDGLLTAQKPGPVRVHVRARDPKDAAFGEPGSLDLVIAKTVPGGRLPRVSGGPPLERFDLDWDRSGFDKNRGLYLAVEALRWRAGATTVAPPEGPLPWTLKAVPERSQVDDEDLFRCCTSVERQKQMQSYVTSATLTIRAWKDGVASGRFVLKTSRGVDLDVVFDTPLADRDGALAKASEPKDAVPPR